MTLRPKSNLPRLERQWYQGRAAVLWTHTMEKRATGWLDDSFHSRFREVLLHACARHGLVCPAYVLMPDHWHVVWLGLAESSDQYLAARFLRKHLALHLGSARLQDRAHDHVLREKERERGAFIAACGYVRENPVRAGLCENWREWPFAGVVVVGYPDLEPRENGYWEMFWRIHGKLEAGA
jgi:putative transposase